MLKIKDNVDLKELEKYKIYPHYTCHPQTGEVYIDGYERDIVYGFLRFQRKRKSFTKALGFNRQKNKFEYEIIKTNYYNLDTIYDLIKADLVEKVDDK